jgi:hypothetical protein
MDRLNFVNFFKWSPKFCCLSDIFSSALNWYIIQSASEK